MAGVVKTVDVPQAAGATIVAPVILPSGNNHLGLYLAYGDSISQGAGTVQEETTLLASGTLTVTDPDADQSAFQAQSGTPGTYGSFSIDAAGHWTYTLDNGNPLVQGLATGDTRSETFTVASLDGTESTVVVTVLGLNEVIGAPGVGIVKDRLAGGRQVIERPRPRPGGLQPLVGGAGQRRNGG